MGGRRLRKSRRRRPKQLRSAPLSGGVLSDKGIKAALKRGDITITPTPGDEQYTTSAVDLYLDGEFRQWDKKRLKEVPGGTVVLDLASQDYKVTAAAFLQQAQLESDGSFVLRPGEFVLAITREHIELKRGVPIAARVEGRSSLARLGLVVHLTAPTIHAGFRGPITLEMVNHGFFHLKLTPNKTAICQLIFERLESPPEGEIQTQFQDQIEPAGRKRPS
jgi:dCTP deaminase